MALQIVKVGFPGPSGPGIPTINQDSSDNLKYLQVVAGVGPGSFIAAWQALVPPVMWAFHDYGNIASFPGTGFEFSKYTVMAVNFHVLSLDVKMDILTPGKRAILKLAMDSNGARTITLRRPDGGAIVWLGGTPAWSSGANQVDQVEVWTDDGLKLYGKLLGLNTT